MFAIRNSITVTADNNLYAVTAEVRIFSTRVLEAQTKFSHSERMMGTVSPRYASLFHHSISTAKRMIAYWWWPTKKILIAYSIVPWFWREPGTATFSKSKLTMDPKPVGTASIQSMQVHPLTFTLCHRPGVSLSSSTRSVRCSRSWGAGRSLHHGYQKSN